jgi:LEA14-like dessication related protein
MRTLIAAALAVTLSGCAYLSQFLQSAFKQPAFAFKNLGLENIDLGGLTLDTIWQLDNPNNVGLSLASIEYALLVDEKQVVSGAPPQGLNIAANGSSDLHFPAGIKFQDLVQVVETFLTKDSATYAAKGALGINTPIGVIRLPLEKTGNFEVPKIPAIQFGNPKVTNLSITGATIEFPLQVTNRSSFPLPVGNVTGAINVAGSSIGTISTGDLGAMLGQGTKQVSLPLNVSFLSAAGALVNAIRGGQAPLAFDAKVQSGQTVLPLKVDQLVNFVR